MTNFNKISDPIKPKTLQPATISIQTSDSENRSVSSVTILKYTARYSCFNQGLVQCLPVRSTKKNFLETKVKLHELVANELRGPRSLGRELGYPFGGRGDGGACGEIGSLPKPAVAAGRSLRSHRIRGRCPPASLRRLATCVNFRVLDGDGWRACWLPSPHHSPPAQAR